MITETVFVTLERVFVNINKGVHTILPGFSGAESVEFLLIEDHLVRRRLQGQVGQQRRAVRREDYGPQDRVGQQNVAQGVESHVMRVHDLLSGWEVGELLHQVAGQVEYRHLDELLQLAADEGGHHDLLGRHVDAGRPGDADQLLPVLHSPVGPVDVHEVGHVAIPVRCQEPVPALRHLRHAEWSPQSRLVEILLTLTS